MWGGYGVVHSIFLALRQPEVTIGAQTCRVGKGLVRSNHPVGLVSWPAFNSPSPFHLVLKQRSYKVDLALACNSLGILCRNALLFDAAILLRPK